MKILILTAIAAMALCACEKKAKNVAGPAEQTMQATENCVETSERTACFLDLKSNGRSEFFARPDDYKTLLTSGNSELSIHEIDKDAYQQKLEAQPTIKVVYRRNGTMKLDIQNLEEVEANGKIPARIERIGGGPPPDMQKRMKRLKEMLQKQGQLFSFVRNLQASQNSQTMSAISNLNSRVPTKGNEIVIELADGEETSEIAVKDL